MAIVLNKYRSHFTGSGQPQPNRTRQTLVRTITLCALLVPVGCGSETGQEAGGANSCVVSDCQAAGAAPSCMKWACISGSCMQVAATNGADCDDGDDCTVGDSCTGGVCKSGGLKDCDDGDTCTTGEECKGDNKSTTNARPTAS